MPGHKGHSRALSEHPDQTITHRPAACAKCGQPFAADTQGGLGNLLRRSKPALDAGKALILQQVRQAKAVASDETGVWIEGVNALHWVFRTPNAILHEAPFSRGAQVVCDVMAGHRPTFWTSYRYSAQQGHDERHLTCLAHLARDIAYALEVSDDLAPFWLNYWMDNVFAF